MFGGTFHQSIIAADVYDQQQAETHQQAAAAAAERRAALIEAAHAAAGWISAEAEADADLRALREHAIDLALVAPAVEVVWLRPDSIAGEWVGSENAVASYQFRRVLVHPISTEARYSTYAHEIGHLRVGKQSTLIGEAAAWRWAMQNAVIWTRAMHLDLVAALGTYVRATADTTTADARQGIVEIERLANGFEAERARRATVVDRAFQRQHGIMPCESRSCLSPGRFAVVRFDARGPALCRTCGEVEATDAAARAVRHAAHNRLVTARDKRLMAWLNL